MSTTNLQLLAGDRYPAPDIRDIIVDAISVSYPYLLARVRLVFLSRCTMHGHASYEPALKQWRFWPDANARDNVNLRSLLDSGFDVHGVNETVGRLLRSFYRTQAIVEMLDRETVHARRGDA